MSYIDTVSPTAFAGVATITFLLFTLCIIISCLFRYEFYFNKKFLNFFKNFIRSKNRHHHRKPHELAGINRPKINHPHVTINPTDIELDQTKILTQFNQTSQSLVSTPAFIHRTPLQRSPFMTSNRSITSACTGLSYLPTDTPRSVRYTNRKTSTNAIFSDSETPRTRIRRQTRHIGSPYLQTNSIRHHQTYATLTLKRHPDTNNSYESSKKIYDDIDKPSTNENLRDFIQVLDSLAQEKFGENDINTITFEKESNIASSPTETNESITLDSGYQSTKQLMNTDEYAVVVKTKRTNEKIQQRRRSYSSIDNKEQFCT